MTIEEIEELIESYRIEVYHSGLNWDADDDTLADYELECETAKGNLKDAIMQYGCESASEAFTMGYNAAKSDYEKTGAMDWSPEPKDRHAELVGEAMKRPGVRAEYDKIMKEEEKTK